MRTACTILAACTMLAGCYPCREYAEPVGPLQAMTVRTTPVDAAPRGALGPSVHVYRVFHGLRPRWFEPGYCLPEPTVVRTSDGSLYITEHVWGFPPEREAPPYAQGR